MSSSSRHAFGQKIRLVRQRAKKTMKEVAVAADISVSLLSQIENDKVSPSIDTLLSITDVLEIDLEYLFRDLKKTGSVEVTRESEQSVIHETGATFRRISRIGETPDEHAIEAIVLMLEPGSVTGNSTYGHKGRELGYILEGMARLEYGTNSFDLQKGDSVTFASEIPHKLTNTGSGVLRSLWINTPPRVNFAG
jgi:transcriptional regulator with XRE-family HTH domain